MRRSNCLTCPSRLRNGELLSAWHLRLASCWTAKIRREAMPKRTDISSILIIGAGPILIGEDALSLNRLGMVEQLRVELIGKTGHDYVSDYRKVIYW